MNRAQFLKMSGLEAATLEVWIEQQWVVPQTRTVYSEIDVARVRLINQLRHDMGANDAGIDIILHLVDQLHSLRHAMDDVRGQLSADSAKPKRTKAGPSK